MNKFIYGACAAVSLVAASHLAVAQTPPSASGLHVIQRIPGPDGGWDYASYDAASRRILIAHGTRVSTVDTVSGKLTPELAKGTHLHAALPVPGTPLILTTDSGDDSARLVDGKTGKPVAVLHVAKDPDGAVYDPATKQVIVVNGEPGELTLVDPKNRRIAGTVHVGEPLEFAAVDGEGRAFVNLEEANAVAVVDLQARRVVKRFPLIGCERPTGLAYVEGNRLISACGNGVAKVLDASSGHEIANLEVGGFPDAVIYDPLRHLTYIPSAIAGTLAVVALEGANANTVVDQVITEKGARTGAVDPTTGRVYLPAAEYVPTKPGARPATKPGTFVVLVLGR